MHILRNIFAFIFLNPIFPTSFLLCYFLIKIHLKVLYFITQRFTIFVVFNLLFFFNFVKQQCFTNLKER